MTSRGWEQDLIESIAEDIALTSHIEERLRSSENEEEIRNLKLMLEKVLDLRREKMSFLLEQGENPNPLNHCIAKHAIGSFWRQQEVWEARLDERSLGLLKKNSEILAMGISLYLGLEFQTCQRCLEELLMAKEYEKNLTDTIES